MSNEKIFEIAVKNKMRFPFKGLISVEDLWDLSVQDLDLVFKTLNSKAKQMNEESLLNTKTKEDKMLDIQIQIVKYIVQDKLAEEDDKLRSRVKKEQRQKIMSILSAKQEESLQNKSAEELQAMLNELN